MTINKGSQAFPRTEYLRRLAEVKNEMRRREIDVLFVTSPSNITYLTGHTAATAYVPQGLVVSLDEEEPTFFLRQMDAPAAIRQTFLARSNVIGYSEDLVGNPDMDGYDKVIEFLHERGLATRGVGLEPGFLTLKQFGRGQDKFKVKLPKARIVDCSKAIDRIRMVKSDLEMVLMRESAAIADAAIVRAAEVIRPGVREADAAAEIVGTLIRGVNGKPGTAISPICFCASPYTGTAHVRWGEDEFRDGSQINLEWGGVRYGYTAAIMRTFIIGAPSDRLRRIHEAEVAGLEAALNTVRPGATCGDIASAFNRTMAKMGFKKESRCGYPIGIDWTEPTASLKEGDITELKPNMTFHLMLGNWVDEDFGYVISETFRVTESGVEVLTNTPRKIFEI
ncbi:M24 family metallopeptidase [Bradyrhizobium zhanjiangense]|uniref:M24 family metallopeptidase n=1 Tax=Bradyrhizobium zhanjiangense TaxID=1325107 RepID=UPI001008BE30|nr:Xaa-Pro peptidase family protein [Bradyrhizobium zhanjiangense]